MAISEIGFYRAVQNLVKQIAVPDGKKIFCRKGNTYTDNRIPSTDSCVCVMYNYGIEQKTVSNRNTFIENSQLYQQDYNFQYWYFQFNLWCQFDTDLEEFGVLEWTEDVRGVLRSDELRIILEAQNSAILTDAKVYNTSYSTRNNSNVDQHIFTNSLRFALQQNIFSKKKVAQKYDEYNLEQKQF